MVDKFMDELIFLKPYCKDVIWGGNRLRSEYGYEGAGDKTGEAWVVSAMPGGESVVANGPFAGCTLRDLWRDHRELFGNAKGEAFPLLVKIIDAFDHLSIQVHPDDAYAAAKENGANGKTECWYILDCDEGADIVIGHHAKTKEELRCMVEEGRWDDLINVIPLHKGDFFFITPGTVHAIRKGTLLLEIQQSSDITYRLYDYQRRQPDGSLRQLHLQQSMDVIRCPQGFQKTEEEPKQAEGYTSQRLVSCEFFTVDKYLISKQCVIDQTKPYLIVDVTSGEGFVNGQKIKKGEHFIATSKAEKLVFEGTMELVVSFQGN